MSTFTELFPDGASRKVFESEDMLKAVCAVADEVRALRLAKAPYSLDLSAAMDTPGFPAEPAKSERIQYPLCELCGVYHHPDHWKCNKHGESGVTLEMITPQPNENLSDAEFPTPGANAQAATDATMRNATYENRHAQMQYEAIKKANKEQS